jgi:hypothetical protein
MRIDRARPTQATLGLLLALASPPALAGDTLLVVRSTPGVLPGGVDSLVMRPTGVSFVFTTSWMQELRLAVSGEHHWSLRALAGRSRPLELRGYAGAVSWGTAIDTLPRFTLSGDGRAWGDTYSHFDVRQLEFDGSGAVRRARLLFEQQGGADVITGELRFDADTVVRIVAPLRQRARRGIPLALDVGVLHSTGAPVTLTSSGLPPGATFQMLTPTLGRLDWTPAADQQGDFHVAFTAVDGASHGEEAHTWIQVDGDTLADIVSEPGDRMFPGRSVRLRPGDMTTKASQMPGGGGVSLLVTPKVTPPWAVWMTHSAPGNYALERRWSSDEFGAAELIVSPIPQGACTRAETRFRIRRLAIDAGGSGYTSFPLRSFWVEWEQHCDAETPAFRGEVRLNAGRPTVVHAPIARMVRSGDELTFPVWARDTLGRPVTIGSGPLPAGAVFTSTGPNTSEFRWTPGVTSRGPHSVMFTAQAVGGPPDTVVTDLMVTAEVSARIQSETGDPAGAGLVLQRGTLPGTLLAPSLATTSQQGTYDAVLLSSAAGAYTLRLRDLGDLLRRTGRFRVGWPGASYGGFLFDCLATNGGSDGYTADLRVREIQRSPAGQLRSAWLQFEQRSSEVMPILSGEIRWNTAWSVIARAPMRRAATVGRSIAFDVAGETSDGAPAQVTALQIPPRSSATPVDPSRVRFEWTPDDSDLLTERTAAFVATRPDGVADTTWTALEALRPGVLHIVEGEDTWHLTSEHGQFRARLQAFSAGVVFSSPFADTVWTVRLLEPWGDPLTLGYHPPVSGFLGYPLCVERSARPYDFYCSNGPGSFDLLRLDRSGADGANTLWATFEKTGYAPPSRVGWLEYGSPGLVSVDPVTGSVPGTFACDGFVPHPSLASSQLSLRLPRGGTVRAILFDVLGRRRWEQAWDGLEAGSHLLPSAGLGSLAPGVYLLRVEFENERVARRVTLLD